MATSKKIVMAAAGAGGGVLFSFSSFTFTAAGVEGRFGPSLSTLLAHSTYATKTTTNTWLTNTSYFNMTTNGIQQFTVPETASYRITAVGGSGGQHQGTFFPAYPGQGATAQGDFALASGDVLNIVVGQTPTSQAGQSPNLNGSAGGGGSWVYTGAIGGSGLIICAGGGGGTGHGGGSSGGTTAGGNGRGGSNGNSSRESTGTATYGVISRIGARQCGNKGIGQGGKSTLTGGNVLTYRGSGGGAGWLSDGDDYSTASAFGGDRFIGGAGDSNPHANGGFGGGGGSGGSGNAGGGGGGYTGAGAGDGYQYVLGTIRSWGGGGGGGSFTAAGASNASLTRGDDGIAQSNAVNGTVTIQKLP